MNLLLNTSTDFYYGQHGVYIKTYFIIAETEQGVAQAIIRSVVNFKRDPWPKVSDNAKDLVKKMLNPDPSKRLTAQEVLGKALAKGVLFNYFVSHVKIHYSLSKLNIFALTAYRSSLDTKCKEGSKCFFG